MSMNIRVAAILIKDGRILLVNHRRLGRSYWVLPGGKLKPEDLSLRIIVHGF